MNKRHYEHTLPNIRGSLSNTYYQNWKICYTTKLKTTKISKNGSDLQQGKTE